jgi:hypothetical protein
MNLEEPVMTLRALVKLARCRLRIKSFQLYLQMRNVRECLDEVDKAEGLIE